MRRGPVALAASALFVAALLVGAATSSGSRSGQGITAPGPCESSQLALSAGDVREGGGLQGGAVFSFTNTSSSTCTVAGYPTFSARELGGRAALQRVQHGGLFASPSRPEDVRRAKVPVVLTPHSSAEFAVGWFTNQPSQYCLDPPTLDVASVPPGDTRALVTRLHITRTLCGPITVGFVAVVIP